MNKKINLIFGLSLIIKLLYALYLPLVLDEYYYFLWGQHLSLSYFDHPPMVGWMMSLSQSFVTVFEGALRWPFIIMSHITLYFWYQILKNELPTNILIVFILTALLNPLWGLGSLIATPDIPLLFFWTLAILITKKLLENNSYKFYVLLGAVLGLGFISKYQIVLFLPALLWLLIQQKKMRLLFSWKTLLTIMTGFIFCSPVLIWNYQNEWASFVFQWKHGMTAQKWIWKYPVDYITSEVFLIFPTFLLFFFSKNIKWKNHWLLPFALFPLLFFLYTSFKGRVEGNWPIMAFPALYAMSYLLSTTEMKKWMQRTNFLWLVLLLLISFLLPFKTHFNYQKIKLFESDRFKNILTSLKEDRVYYAFNYQLSGYLSFKKQTLICKFPLYGRVDHFNYMKECQSLPKQFTLITEKTAYLNLKNDLPDYEIVQNNSIDETFMEIEMRKK